MRVIMFVGPTKTGTTAIWHALHVSGVPLPPHNKETFYFDRYYSHCKEHYIAKVCGGSKDVIVEVSPTYFCSHEAPYRIYDMFPSAHIVITLREPIARTISCYRHSSRYRDFDLLKAFEEDEQVAASRYRQYCARWLSVFGRDNVIVVRQDDLGRFPNEIFPKLALLSGVEVLSRVKVDAVRRNAAVVTRSKYVARTLNRLNYYLRHNGASQIVEIAKHMGCRSLIYKRGASGSSDIDEAQLRTLRELLSAEIRFYNMLRDPLTSGQELLRLLAPDANISSVCGS